MKNKTLVGAIDRCEEVLDGPLQIHRKQAPAIYLTRLLPHLPVTHLSTVLPHFTSDTNMLRVLFTCRRKSEVSLGLLHPAWGFICLNSPDEDRTDLSLVFAEHSPDLIVSWGEVGRMDYVVRPPPVLRIDKIAASVWSHRLGQLNFGCLERSVLGAPPEYTFQGQQAHRGVLISCGLLVHLAYAAQAPSLLSEAEDLVGLGLLSGHLGLTRSCLERTRGRVSQATEAQLWQHIKYLDPDQPESSHTSYKNTDIELPEEIQIGLTAKNEESARRDRQRKYSLMHLQELYHFRDRTPLHSTFKPAKKGKKKVVWGYPVTMREDDRHAILKAEGVPQMYLNDLWKRLTVGENHMRCHKRNVYDDSPEKPTWRHHGDQCFSPKHVRDHLLCLGVQEGFTPYVERQLIETRADGSLRVVTERFTRVLVVKLDNNGDELLPLKDRYDIFKRCLPGGWPFRSSDTGGLSLWYFLPLPIDVPQLVNRVLECLGDALHDLGRRDVEGSGWTVKPDMKGNNELCLFGGFGSVPLDEDLEPLNLGLAELVNRILGRARWQESKLRYLMEKPTVFQEQPSSTQRDLFETNPPRKGKVPQALSDLRIPRLIRDDDLSNEGNRWVIVGRALGVIGGQTTDKEVAWSLLEKWLRDPVNAHLSSSDSTATENHLKALHQTFEHLWPFHLTDESVRRGDT